MHKYFFPDEEKVIPPQEISNRLCSKLKLSRPTKKAIMEVLKKCEEINIIKRTPESVVAGAILLVTQAAGEKRTRKEICNTCLVSDTSMIRSYEDLYRHARILFPDDFNFVTPIDCLLSWEPKSNAKKKSEKQPKNAKHR